MGATPGETSARSAAACRITLAARAARGFAAIVGQSKAIHQLLDQAPWAASAELAPLVICGEAGTGKSLFAQAIHQNSPRSRRCIRLLRRRTGLTARHIEQELLERRLAPSQRRWAAALVGRSKRWGRTLFLSDVADLPAVTQGRLARSLDRWQFMGSNGAGSRPFDVRLIVATVRKLDASPPRGGFQQACSA